MKLWDFPVFGTTKEVMHCTKFLINIIHGGSLWLNKEYPIDGNGIYNLIGLSPYGLNVSSMFKNVSKCGKKKGDDNLYKKYSTQHKVHGAVIDMNNNEKIKFSCHIIIGKLMCHYHKGEYTLDIIFVAEAFDRGEILNWCNFLLNEIFEACKDVYKWVPYFIYGYLFVSIAMLKWCSTEGRELAKVLDLV